MEFVADFHIHSKYSRATSSEMNVEALSSWAKTKGIKLLGTGDWTHPLWLAELKEKLTPAGKGLFEYNGTFFILTVEVYNLFYRNGKAKSIHNIIFAPDFKTADEINKALKSAGDLRIDGRPILKMDPSSLVKTILGINSRCLIVPAHVWTPHFSLFGSNSGFDSIEECFEDQTRNIHCLETGLSSDPAMNWRWSALDRFSLISNSDSHSPRKIGREANVFNAELDYDEIITALKEKDSKKFLYTVEFFPEEGKYHYDGHRLCKVRLSPSETRKNKGLCPGCGKKVTVGVMNRVEKLCDRKEGFNPESAIPFKNAIPLEEIIADAFGVGVATMSVEREYKAIIQRLGNEFDILFKVDEKELLESANPKVAEGILKVRKGDVQVLPGYDGEYGKVHIFEHEEKKEKQLTFF